MGQLLPVLDSRLSQPTAATARPAIAVVGSGWSYEKFEQLLGIPGPYVSDGGCHVVASRVIADGSVELDLQGGGLPKTTVCFWPPGVPQAFVSTEGFALGYQGANAREPLFSLLKRAAYRLQKADLRTLVKVVLMDPAKTVVEPASRAEPTVVVSQPGPDQETASPTSEERLKLFNTCNLRCVYCGPQLGPVVTWEDVEPQLRAMHARHGGDLSHTRLLITGGEPTLSPVLPETLRLARDLGFCDILITTHGVRLADAKYADTLAEAGLTHVELSLRSFHEQNYDHITGTTGKFKRAMAGLHNSVARFDVMANLVINRHNYTEILHTVQHLAELKTTTRRRVSLMPSIVIVESVELAEKQYREISAPNEMLMPHLAEAVRWDHGQSPRIFVPEFSGQCYAPPCATADYPELLEHAPVQHPVSWPIVYLDAPPKKEIPFGTRVKATTCRSCRYDTGCRGVAPGNAALYGFSELVPLN